MVNLKDLQSDLQKIDFKNLDAKKVQTLLADNKDFAAQIAVGVISLFIAVFIYNDFALQSGKYNSEINTIKAKIDIEKSYDVTQKKIKEYMEHFPKELTEQEIATKIAEYAFQSNVSVESFSPVSKNSNIVSDVWSMDANIRAKTFKDILTFIKSIEGSPFALRVDGCSLTPAQNNSNTGNGMDHYSGTVSVSSVALKK